MASQCWLSLTCLRWRARGSQATIDGFRQREVKAVEVNELLKRQLQRFTDRQAHFRTLQRYLLIRALPVMHRPAEDHQCNAHLYRSTTSCDTRCGCFATRCMSDLAALGTR